MIGRFIGFVRPLAPFIAGTSRMTYGRFLPYSVVGTGLWGTTFCLLGYIFWRSFDKVSKIAGPGDARRSACSRCVIGGIVYARHRLKDPAERERLERWMNSHRVTRWAWHWFVRPVVRVAWPQIRFLWHRLTPGQARARVHDHDGRRGRRGATRSSSTRRCCADDVDRVFPLDNTAFDIADRIRERHAGRRREGRRELRLVAVRADARDRRVGHR